MADDELTRTLTGGDGAPIVDDLAPGQTVGRYVLVERIGQGGAGIVWAATDPLLGDEVAVKLVPWLEPRAMRQYRRELATLLVLQIPGVVRIRDEGEHGSFVYVVTERLHGRPFSSLAEAPIEAWLPSVFALLDTLARVHLARVTHADLKPGNIVVDSQGVPTILDFGLARMRGPAVVREGVVEGSPRYMAPEQRRGETVTPRTDLYAIGGMLLEMIQGTPLTSPPDLAGLSDLDGHAARLAEVLPRMLAADPADRPDSAMEVLAALDVDPTPDPVRWLGEGPWTQAQLEALFDDLPESLLHLAEDGAALLFEEAGGDAAVTCDVLRRWVRAGDVRWTADGRIEVTRPELERLRARRSDAPEQRLATMLAEGVDEAEVTAEALQSGRTTRGAGATGSGASAPRCRSDLGPWTTRGGGGAPTAGRVAPRSLVSTRAGRGGRGGRGLYGSAPSCERRSSRSSGGLAQRWWVRSVRRGSCSTSR